MGVRFPLGALAAVGMTACFAMHATAVSVESVRENFTAVAINLNGRATTTRVEIRIERWSNDQEREQLLDILKRTSQHQRHEPAALARAAENAKGRLHSNAGHAPMEPPVRAAAAVGRRLAQTRILIDRRTSNLVLEDYALLPVRPSQIRAR